MNRALVDACHISVDEVAEQECKELWSWSLQKLCFIKVNGDWLALLPTAVSNIFATHAVPYLNDAICKMQAFKLPECTKKHLVNVTL